jgi:ComF family protein
MAKVIFFRSFILFSKMLRDFLSLIYPQLCMACGKSLYNKEVCLCTFCRYNLPKTNFHLQPENPVSKLFWGRVNITSAASYYQFSKGGKVQKLIHQLKYKDQKEIGLFIGQLYGNDLRSSEVFNSVDLVIPIPLHPKKLKKRGYNQSALFAEGIGLSMNKMHDLTNVSREIAADSQTRKSRFNRWKNVESNFRVKYPEKLKNKHVLIVDDVITTGSTLEACAQAILAVPGTKVSIVTIAYAGI